MNAFSQKSIAANLAEFAHLCGDKGAIAVNTKGGSFRLRALNNPGDFDRVASGIGFPKLSAHLERATQSVGTPGQRYYIGVLEGESEVGIIEITDVDGTLSTTAVLPSQSRKEIELDIRTAGRTLERTMNALRAPRPQAIF